MQREGTGPQKLAMPPIFNDFFHDEGLLKYITYSCIKIRTTMARWAGPGSGKSFMMCLAVSTQYRRVMDRRTDRQRDGRTGILRQHCPRYA